MTEERRIFPEVYRTGTAQCLSCGHEWRARWPLAAEPLYCPECDSNDTYREADVKPKVIPA